MAHVELGVSVEVRQVSEVIEKSAPAVMSAVGSPEPEPVKIESAAPVVVVYSSPGAVIVNVAIELPDKVATVRIAPAPPPPVTESVSPIAKPVPVLAPITAAEIGADSAGFDENMRFALPAFVIVSVIAEAKPF